MTKEAQIVLEAIKNQTSPPDDMPDATIWKAERELTSLGLIRREDGDWTVVS